MVAEMKRKKISKVRLATAIEVDPSFLSKIFAGKKPWPAQLLSKAQAWVTGCVEPETGEQTTP
jgi:hypothetical protein